VRAAECCSALQQHQCSRSCLQERMRNLLVNSYVYVCVSVMFPVFFGDAESFIKILRDQRMCKIETNNSWWLRFHTRGRGCTSLRSHTHTQTTLTHTHTHTHTHVLSTDVHICNVKHLRIRSLSRISARGDFSLQCVYRQYCDTLHLICVKVHVNPWNYVSVYACITVCV